MILELYRARLGTNIRKIPVQALKDGICKTNPRRFFPSLAWISERKAWQSQETAGKMPRGKA